VAEQAAKADDLVDEVLDAGLDGSHPITVHAKMLRLRAPECEEGAGARTAASR